MELEQRLIPYEAVKRLTQGPMLVFAPHPDDEVLGCGGAIAAQRAAGLPVEVIIVTDGRGFAPDEARAGYVAGRREESRAAARILGYGGPEFWDYPDRGLQVDYRLLERIRQRIADRRPELVLAPSLHERHPDHLAQGYSPNEHQLARHN